MKTARPMTGKQQDMVDQVVATLAIENMTVPEDGIRLLEELAADRKTISQVIDELNRKDWNE